MAPTADDAARTERLLEATGVKECRVTPGNRGVYVLRREHGGRAEFLLISLWDSFGSIRKFAGPGVEKAVYYPKDKEFLIEVEPRVPALRNPRET